MRARYRRDRRGRRTPRRGRPPRTPLTTTATRARPCSQWSSSPHGGYYRVGGARVLSDREEVDAVQLARDALDLRAAERAAGVAQHVLGLVVAVQAGGDADGRRRQQFSAVEDDRLLDALAQALGDADGVALVGDVVE